MKDTPEDVQRGPTMSKPTMTLADFQKELAAAGYDYGSDAAENALVGYELAHAHLAEREKVVDVVVAKTCYGEVIHALAAIVTCPQTDAQCDAEVIPRDPVMREVMRIRKAMDKLTRATFLKQSPASPRTSEQTHD